MQQWDQRKPLLSSSVPAATDAITATEAAVADWYSSEEHTQTERERKGERTLLTPMLELVLVLLSHIAAFGMTSPTYSNGEHEQ